MQWIALIVVVIVAVIAGRWWQQQGAEHVVDAQNAALPAVHAPNTSDPQSRPIERAQHAQEYAQRRPSLQSITRLADSADASAEQQLSRIALHGRDIAAREEALFRYTERSGVDALPTLRLVLEHEPSLRVQRSAVRALADVGNDEALLLLREVLDGADVRLRIDALDALGDIGSAPALAIIDGARHDPDPRVRDAANDWFEELKRAQEDP